MRAFGTLFLLALLGDTCSALAQPERELRGQVFHLGENGEKVYEPGYVVTLLETGSSCETNDQGWFHLPLLPSSQPGDRVTLNVGKTGWRIRYPLDGETVVAASQSELIKVELLPAGSVLFWTNDRIEKFIRDIAEKSKRDAEAHGRTGREKAEADLGANFDRYLKDWAIRYGFTPEDAQRELDRWIAETDANREDSYGRGLADFARRRFSEAARHFRDSADLRAHNLEEIRRRKQALTERETQLRIEFVRDLRLEGDAHFQAGDYRTALAAYVEAHDHTSRDGTAELWAATLDDLAQVHVRLGTQGSPSEIAFHLEQAVQALREALDVYTSEKEPQEWAMAQNHLGSALLGQATRTEGERSERLLIEASDTFRKGLLVSTRVRFPEVWARSQNNLGNVLLERGMRTVGERSIGFLTEAIEAYSQALLVRTREHVPDDWAATQNNLGVALQVQGARTQGEPGARLMTKAVEVYQQALSVNTRAHAPQEWARIQSNIAAALFALGRRTEGERSARFLGDAVAAGHQALLVYTPKQFPQDWARTLSNIGMTLHVQGERTEGEPGVQLLSESVAVSLQVLSFYTREDLPQDWARTQNTLGEALQDEGERTAGNRGVHLLEGAVEAFRKALLVRTKEQLPARWASLQQNLGDTLLALGARIEGDGGTHLLAEAVEAYNSAVEVFTYEDDPQRWTENKMGRARALLLQDGDQEGAEELLKILGKKPAGAKDLRLLALVLADRFFDPRQALLTTRQCHEFNVADIETRLFEVEALFSIQDFLEPANAALGNRSVAPSDETASEASSPSRAARSVANLIQEMQASLPDAFYRDWMPRLFLPLKSSDRNRIIEGLSLFETELSAMAKW